MNNTKRAGINVIKLLFLEIALIAACSIAVSAPVERSLALENDRVPSSSTEVSSGVSMRVLWSVSEYKISGGAIMGEEEARTFLFKPLNMDATNITFAGQICHNVSFEREMVDSKEYLSRVYHTTPQVLGIGEEVVEVIKTNCDLPGFKEYMRLRDRRLIIYINGVFFFFQPNVNY